MFKSVKTGLGLACVLAVMAGCSSTDTDDSASANQLDQTPPPVVEETTTQAPVALDNVVYFDFDQSLLKPSTRELLIKHADRMRSATSTVRLEGHADELGTRECQPGSDQLRLRASGF
jgi:peptidoglycan-associated lipoprotein